MKDKQKRKLYLNVLSGWEPHFVVQEEQLVAEKERMLWFWKTKINEALDLFLFHVTLIFFASRFVTKAHATCI